MSAKGAHSPGQDLGKSADLGTSAGPDLGVRSARRGNLARNVPSAAEVVSGTDVTGMPVDTE